MATTAELINDISQILPTPFIDLITLESGRILQADNIESTRVLINLSLKDIVEKDGTSQWFLEESIQEDLKKYMKVHVVLFKSESAYNDFYDLQDSSFFDIEKFISSINGNLENNPIEKLIWRNELSLPKKEELKLNKGTFYSENYISDNEDGTKELTVPLYTKFEIPLVSDAFLGIIVFLTFNLKEFAESVEASGDDTNEDNALSKAFASETILNNGKVVSETKYFILPDGEFYFGQFHVIFDQDNNIIYKTGTAETEESQVLSLVTDINNRIQDFRIRKNLFKNKISLDETGIINTFFKNDTQLKQITQKNKSNQQYSKYFSNMLTSLDDKGNCRFTFFFDKANFALENCFYPPLIDNKILAEQFIIKNISVLRTRKDIKEVNETSENEEVFIASNSHNPQSNVDILNNPNLTLFNGSYICENAIQGINSAEVKNYSVLDTQVSKLNQGIYQYKIKIDFIDPTKEYLKKIIFDVAGGGENESVLRILEKYFIISQSNKKIKLNMVGDVKNQSGVKFIPYFDVLSGAFIKEFKKDFPNDVQKALNSVETFIKVAKQFKYFVFSNTLEQEAAFKSLINLVDPDCASPDSILVFIEIVKDFITKVKSLLGITDSGAPAKVFSKYLNNFINIEHKFDINNSNLNYISTSPPAELENFFNAAIINGSGFKTVDKFEQEENFGLNAINLQNYKSLTDDISKKHFNEFTTLNIKTHYEQDFVDPIYNFTDQFDNDDSKYSFLPISYVGTINKQYSLKNLKQNFFDQKFYEKIFLDILNYNTLKLSNFETQPVLKNSPLNQDEQIIKGQLLNLFTFSEFSNISSIENLYEKKKDFEIKQQSPFDIFGKSFSGDILANIIDSQDSKNKESSQVSQTDPNADPSSLLLEILLHEIMREGDLNSAREFEVFCPLDEKENKNKNFFLDKVVESISKEMNTTDTSMIFPSVQNYISNLPLPLKHLIISRGNISGVIKAYKDNNENNATIYAENFFKYWINFKKLYEIQYFAGFDKSIRLPIWKRLTIDVLSNSQNKILCRTVNFKLRNFEKYFPDIRKLEMPLLDKYFFIIPNNSISLAENVKNEIAKENLFLSNLTTLNTESKKKLIGLVSNLSINKAVEKAQNVETEKTSTSLVQVSRLQTLSSLSNTNRPRETATVEIINNRIEPIAQNLLVIAPRTTANSTDRNTLSNSIITERQASLTTQPISAAPALRSDSRTAQQTEVSARIETQKTLSELSVEKINTVSAPPQVSTFRTSGTAENRNLNTIKRLIKV